MQRHTRRMSSAHAPAQHGAGKAWQSQCERGYADGRSVCSMAWPGIARQRMGWHITSWWRRASVPSAACSIECSAEVHDLGNSEAGFSAARSQQGRQLLHRSQLRWHGRVRRRRAVGLGEQARGGGVKEACKEAQFDWGRPARHGIIEMSRSGAFDVVQVATHVCSQGGVGHVRIMGGGILCFKALPDLPQQGKRETKLFKQQIVLRSRVKVNVDVTESFYQAMLQSVRWTNGDYIGLHRESTHCGIFRRVTPTPKVLKTTRLATGLKCRRRGDDDD